MKLSEAFNYKMHSIKFFEHLILCIFYFEDFSPASCFLLTINLYFDSGLFFVFETLKGYFYKNLNFSS